MPNIKSAKKRARQSLVRRERNRSHKSAMRTQVKKFLTAIDKGEKELVETEFRNTMKNLDMIAQKKILHKNNIARKKSKVQKKYNEFVDSAS